MSALVPQIQTAIWECSGISSPEKKIAAQLLLMAQFRGGTTSKEVISLYSKRLSAAPPDLVQRAIIYIAESSIREGEKAFPEIGKILELMNKYEVERCRLMQRTPTGGFQNPEKRKI